MSGTEISVDFGPWVTTTEKFNELSRLYRFKNLGGPGTATDVELRCRLNIRERQGFFKSEATKVATAFVYLVVEPYMLEQTRFVVAMFAPSDALADFEVLSAKVEAAATGVNFIVFDESKAEHLVSILKLGRRVTLRLMTPPEMETVALIPLENDYVFEIEYDKFSRALVGR